MGWGSQYSATFRNVAFPLDPMMQLMNRTEAIRMLVERDLKKLDPDARSRILQEWWTVLEVDDGYETLPDDLKQHLKSSDRPERPDDPFYDPLVRLQLAISYIGAQN